MGNKLTSYEDLEKYIIKLKNKNKTIKKEIYGILISRDENKINERVVYILLLDNEKYIKCLILVKDNFNNFPIKIKIEEFILNIQNYLIILKYKVIQEQEKINTIFQNKNNLNSLKIYDINELQDINKEILISIDLIYLKKQLKVFFKDIKNNNVNVNYDIFIKNNPKFFGRNHIYNFKNVLYSKNIIKIISISSIQEINENFIFDEDDYENLNNIKNENILNFKSKIIDFCFKDNLIKTNGFIIKLDSENNLIKNINTN